MARCSYCGEAMLTEQPHVHRSESATGGRDTCGAGSYIIVDPLYGHDVMCALRMGANVCSCAALRGDKETDK